MVFTLHRYVFRELTKVFVPAVLALTVILSLGSILRPIQEYGVGPRQVLDLMLYFLPITLTFVLPMAALFAGTLVYGRLAGDNELDACKASGVSLLTLVYPGLALAIIVAICNLILSFHVMPVFVHQAEKSFKADAKQILFRNVQRKPYYKLPPDGRYFIYADYANPQDDTLSGVVVAELKNDKIEKIITAQTAKVTFNPSDRFNEVQITAYKTDQMDSKDQVWFYAEYLSVTTEFSSLLSDNIKFKKIDEMKRIKSDPMRFYPIAKLARETCAQLTTELLARDIAARIATDSNSRSAGYRLHSGEKLVEFTADGVTVGERKVELSGNIMVAESDIATKDPCVFLSEDRSRGRGRCTLRTAKSGKASLHLEGDELTPTLTMDIYNATVDQTGDLRMRYVIRGLVLPNAVDSVISRFQTEDGLLKVEKLASPALLSSVEDRKGGGLLQKGPSPELTALQNRLGRKLQSTLAEIEAEVHSRLVFGIGCVSMILIGIGLGILKKGGHPLTAFGVSCIPAAVLVVCIMSGKQIAAQNVISQSSSGIVFMWAGLVFLSLLAVGIYRRLLKY
jgi:lipopolysaccharide export LptBFGC system permease protein LptF